MNFPFFFGWNQVQFQYFFFRWLPNPIIWIIVSQKVVCRCLLSHFCFFFSSPLASLVHTHTHISLKTFTRHWLCFVISPVVISSLGEINWSSSLEKKKKEGTLFSMCECAPCCCYPLHILFIIFFFFFLVCVFFSFQKNKKKLAKIQHTLELDYIVLMIWSESHLRLAFNPIPVNLHNI